MPNPPKNFEQKKPRGYQNFICWVQISCLFLFFGILHTEPVKLETVQLSSAMCITEIYFPTTVKQLTIIGRG